MILRANKGFSLIEIIIAITIMAIVAAVVVPQVTSYFTKAKKRTTQIILSNVQNAIAHYKGELNVYPATLEDLKTPPADEAMARKWGGPYFDKKLNDSWGGELVYILNPKGTIPRYELYSWGPNGEGSPDEEWVYPPGE